MTDLNDKIVPFPEPEVVDDQATGPADEAASGERPETLSLEKIRVMYPRWSRIENKLEYCRLWSKDAAEPYCLLVVGPTGVGKSTLIKKYLEKHPPKETIDGQRIPVLYAVSPPVPTTAALTNALLYAIGDEVEKGTHVAKTQRLLKHVQSCQVEMIILDEFQHFVDVGNERLLREVSDWLKNFISLTRIPVVLVGLPHSRELLASNPQLRRRFSAQENLEPFNWKGEYRKEFLLFLEKVDELLPMKFDPPLRTLETAHRMYFASDGRAGHVMKIVRRAIRIAQKEKARAVTWSHLSTAYHDEIINLYDDEVDPFRGELPPIDEFGRPDRTSVTGLERTGPKGEKSPWKRPTKKQLK